MTSDARTRLIRAVEGLLTSPPTPAASAAAWWLDAGVDVIVGDTPCNWLAPERVQKVEQPVAPARPARPSAAPPTLDGNRPATLAASADSPAALAAAFREFAGERAILFEGDPAANVIFILDAPAAAGDGTPHLLGGDAGRLFDAMLASIGRKRETVCLATLAPGAGLAASDMAMTVPFCRRLAELAQPAAAVALGADATALLLGTRSGVGRLRGRFTDWVAGARTLALLPTFHPAFLLAQPTQKAGAWADLRQLRARLGA